MEDKQSQWDKWRRKQPKLPRLYVRDTFMDTCLLIEEWLAQVAEWLSQVPKCGK